MQKIVVNAKPGGFGLSREAAAALGLEVDQASSFMQPYRVIGENALRRDDDRLVDVVETLGQAASGPNAELVVVCVPDGVDWGIAEYDGAEWVAERHRTWMPKEGDAVGYEGVLPGLWRSRREEPGRAPGRPARSQALAQHDHAASIWRHRDKPMSELLAFAWPYGDSSFSFDVGGHRSEVEEYLAVQEREGAEIQSRMEGHHPPEGLRAKLLARLDS